MDNAAYLSPIDLIDENWVPTYFCYSVKDIFCQGQGELLEEKLTQYNIPHCSTWPTKFFANHDYQLFALSPFSKPTLNDTAAYLRAMAEKGTVS